MIKDIYGKIPKINQSPYFSYGVKSPVFNSALLKNNADTYTKQSKNNATNPFEKETNELQEYFNSRFYPINKQVEAVIDNFSQNGKIQSLIEERILEAGAVIAKFDYDKTLPKSELKHYFIKKEKNSNVLSAFNKYKEPLFQAKFSSGHLSSLTIYFEDNSKGEISFAKVNPLLEFFNFNSPKPIVYKRKNSNNEIIEEIRYNKYGQIEQYSGFSCGTKTFDIIFDTDNTQNQINRLSNKKQKLVPLKYCSYFKDGESKMCEVSYLYAKASKYKEFDFTTQKATRVFYLQGIKNQVYKYAFYNPNTTQLISSGKL